MPEPRDGEPFLLETFACNGCRAYLLGDPRTGAAVVIDPAGDQVDRYLAAARRHDLQIRYVVETHTHADHISGARALRQATGAPLAMHHAGGATGIDLRLADGDALLAGGLRLEVLHTPGHTADSVCLLVGDRLFTGDTLLVGGAGRTDLPTGDPEALHDSLFGRVLKLPPETRIYPAHDYRHLAPSTLAAERASNPRLQAPDRAAFVAMMRGLTLVPPKQLVAALRANLTGGRTVEALLADAARRIAFLSPAALADQLGRPANDLVVVDLRDPAAFAAGRIPGSRNLPRGELESLVDGVLPDPAVRIVACCARGQAAPFAAATLRDLGFARTAALEGGLEAWRRAGHPWDSAPAAGDPAP